MDVVISNFWVCLIVFGLKLTELVKASFLGFKYIFKGAGKFAFYGGGVSLYISSIYACFASRMINFPGPVITTIFFPMINPHCSSHRPLMFSWGGYG